MNVVQIQKLILSCTVTSRSHNIDGIVMFQFFFWWPFWCIIDVCVCLCVSAPSAGVPAAALAHPEPQLLLWGQRGERLGRLLIQRQPSAHDPPQPRSEAPPTSSPPSMHLFFHQCLYRCHVPVWKSSLCIAINLGFFSVTAAVEFTVSLTPNHFFGIFI